MKQLVDQFLHYLSHQKRYSKHTTTAYRNDLYSLIDFLDLGFDIQNPSDVTHRIIGSYIADLMEQGLAATSANRKLSAAQSFFDFLIRQGIVDSNPAKKVARPKMPSKLPSILRSEQVTQLFEQIEFSKDFEGVRDRAILMVLYSCGLRREELIGLKVSDIDRSQLSIKVIGKRNKERIIPITINLIEEIDRYIRHRDEMMPEGKELFVTTKGKKLYSSLVYQIVKKYLSMVTTMDKRSPHVLRHTFATHLLNEGANLQSIKELLGHSSLASTQVYTHTSLEKLKEVYFNSHPRNKK